MSDTRHTYKKELIQSITNMFRHSGISAVPAMCLKDMSTASLVAFQEWIDTFIKEYPKHKADQ